RRKQSMPMASPASISPSATKSEHLRCSRKTSTSADFTCRTCRLIHYWIRCVTIPALLVWSNALVCRSDPDTAHRDHELDGAVKEMTLGAGTKLGRYEIRSKIGEGGMGQVYLAHDTELDRPVAIKLLTEKFAADSQRLQRFIQEAKAASAL